MTIDSDQLPQEHGRGGARCIYLTRAEAAQYLNVPPRWLANNAKRGPRYIKVGGLVRYSSDALDSYMTAHEGYHP
ncbi:helix-turn-helix domain-containing protein [Pseudarthrobacter sp. WHRI 8279]|uniref:helix-turn-helix domain-containing protein n=1 Tax=Pseudarthrobacter sp. WHRI 8279 TaxID=3162566 RepID=UPI0032EBC300